METQKRNEKSETKSSANSVSRYFLLGLFALLVATQSGCASYFKRKDCESKNWFEYGQSVAMSGRRLTGDTFVAECRAVEAEFSEVELDRGFKQGMSKYCEPTQAFATGKAGDFFSVDMCDGSNPRALQERHKAGVNEYCLKSNGYAAGAGGRVYNGICPKNLEPAFLPEYRRGRKKYLAVLVNENEKKILDLERDAIDLERQRNMKSLEAQRLQIPSGYVVERTIDPTTGTRREQVVQSVSEEQKRAADNIRHDIQMIDSRITSKRREQLDLREKNRTIQLEVVALDEKSEG